MSKQMICDLCGRPLTADARKFKFKVKESQSDGFGWDRIDCHESCFRVLREAARKRREEGPREEQEPYLIDRNELLKDLNATMAYNAEISAVIMAQQRHSMISFRF